MSKPDVSTPSALTWFEIPCTDIDRATRFYNLVLNTVLKDYHDDEPMRIFPAGEEAIAGALVSRPTMKPGAEGALVYLRCEDDLEGAMERVEPAGGAMVVPKMQVPGGLGHFFVLRDTEGNHVGVHQPVASA